MALDIITRENGAEIVPYNSGDFPLFADTGNIMLNPLRKATWHWHDDWEFASVSRSAMLYHVDSDTILVSPGEGLFVNSMRLHNNAVIDRSDNGYACIVIHPQILTGIAPVIDTCVRKLCGCRAMPYKVLRRSDKSESAILDRVEEINALAASVGNERYLGILSRAAEMIRLLAEMVPADGEGAAMDKKLSALYSMVAFIQTRYQEKLTVEAISKAAYMSAGSCNALFKKYLSTTPMRYVLNYRLEKAAGMLRETDMPITDIAENNGFASHSFFSLCFREAYGISPKAYRVQWRKTV